MSFESEDPRESMQRSVERLLRNIVYQRHPATHFTEPRWSPALDLMVSEHSARVIVELAGVPRQNVRVRLQGRVLEISGRRESPREVGDANDAHYHLAEILFGDFRRSVELPWEADPEHVDAVYRDGMLAIQLVPSPAEHETPVPVEHHETT
jgi:HSP20 family protein